jgi:drug/metabolite transporter (DMT)-like permease
MTHAQEKPVKGSLLILLALLVQESGYAAILVLFGSGSPLAAAILIRLIAAFTFAPVVLWVARKRNGGLGYGPETKWLILRVGIGQVIGSVTYIYAAAQLGIGTAALVNVLGALVVNFWVFVKEWKTWWGSQQLINRVAAFTGVFLVTQAWTGHLDNPWGWALALACAACNWNFIKVTNKLAAIKLVNSRGQEFTSVNTGTALGHLLAAGLLLPALPFAGWPTVTWDQGVGIVVAGLLASTITMAVQNPGIALVNSESRSGMVFSLDPIIASAVAWTGAGLGLMAWSQHPSVVILTGMTLTIGAAVYAAYLGQNPTKPASKA